MRLLLSLFLLLPAAAEAAAPFDLMAERSRYPGSEMVVKNQAWTFDLLDDRLQVVRERTVAILHEGAREDLAMFDAYHRPGCREVMEVDVSVTDRAGSESTLTVDDLLKGVDGVHPTDPARSRQEWQAPRRGLGAGALLTERVVIEYPTACFGGLSGTSRVLGHGSAPVAKERVEVRCVDRGCFAALDRELEAGWRHGDAGLILERVDVAPPPTESATPGQRRPRILVATSDDPLGLARILAPQLDAALPAARAKLGGYLADARDDQKSEGDPALKFARYMYGNVPETTSGSSWIFGADFGEVPKAGSRGLFPLEWWTLAVVGLAPYGGVPVLFDEDAHLPPPDGVAKVGGFAEFGVLLPNALLTRNRLVMLAGGTSPSVADRHFIELGADGPTLRTFEVRADLERSDWTGTVSLTAGDYLKVELSGQLDGARGLRVRRNWLRAVAAAKASKGKKRPASERDRAFVKSVLNLRDAGAGTVEAPKKAPTRVALTAVYSRPAELLSGDGLRTLMVRLPLRSPLAALVLSEPRTEPISVRPAERTIDLLFRTPDGYTLAGLPAGDSVIEGPLEVSASWSEDPEGARLKLRTVVNARYLDPALVGATNRAAELLRKTAYPTLLYLEALEAAP